LEGKFAIAVGSTLNKVYFITVKKNKFSMPFLGIKLSSHVSCLTSSFSDGILAAGDVNGFINFI